MFIITGQFCFFKQHAHLVVYTVHPKFSSPVFFTGISIYFLNSYLNSCCHFCFQRHNMYAIRYWACEALCLVNIIAQLYFMNHFFDGEFFSYGLRVMTFSEQAQEDRVDPMVYVFPRVTKCTFHKYGPSGTIQKHDSLCILPLNIVNEKTYIFLWFWFIILATLLSLLLVYRVVIIAVPAVRPYLLNARNRMVPREIAQAVSRKTDIGDWWILYMLGQNMDPIIYREVVAELAKKIETAASNSP